MLAHLVIENGWDLTVLCPQLHLSMLSMYCRNELLIGDVESIAFANAKLSARGSIRRAHCILTWLGVLEGLKEKGLTASEVVKRWNANSTKESQLLGSKRTALLQLLGLSRTSIKLLLQHLSEFGSNTAFNEDTFAQKRILPGGTFRGGVTKEWQQRLQVTEDSFNLCLEYIHAQHQRKLPGTRCKYSKSAIEEAVNMCGLLLTSLIDMKDQHPLPSKALADVIDHFLAGDMTLEVELQAAISEKASAFTFSDIPTLKKVVAEHVADSQAKMQKLGKSSTVAAAQMERQEFDLMMSMLSHDLDVWKVHLTRSRDRQAAIHFQHLQYRQKRMFAAKDIGDKFLSEVTQFYVLQDAATTFKQIEAFQKKIQQVEQLPSLSNITALVIVNWSAPCIFTAEHQRVHSNIAGAVINLPDRQNIGVYVAPSYCRQRGTAWKQEKVCQESLANSNLNLDDPFVLPFKGKNDEREKRTAND